MIKTEVVVNRYKDGKKESTKRFWIETTNQDGFFGLIEFLKFEAGQLVGNLISYKESLKIVKD